MRLALCVIALAAATSTAAADPCATGAECDKACTASPGPACTAGAELYFDGKNNHPLDHAKSFSLAKRGCDAGEAHACMLLGYHYQDGLGGASPQSLAVDAYTKACTKGFGVACYNLSGMYLGAHGVPHDKAKGEKYGKLAEAAWEAQCKGKDTRWCANHGYALASAGNLKEARKAHQRACDNGTRVGCVEALRLGRELGVVEVPAALAELERHCRGGEPTACTFRGALLYAPDPKAKPGDLTKGLDDVRRGCELGDKLGCMAAFYRLMQLKQDPTNAMKYLNLACDRAHGAACAELSRISFATKREPEGIAYAVRACRIGAAESCGYAGDAYAAGKGVAKDEKLGLALLRDGCRMADTPSCGVLIRRKEELPVPEEQQQKLYTSACKAGLVEACPRVKK